MQRFIRIGVFDLRAVNSRIFSTAGQSKSKGLSKTSADERKKLDLLQKVAAASDAASKFRPQFPPEIAKKHQEIGDEYNRKTTEVTRRLNLDLETKMKLMKAAITALPPHLQEHARSIDRTPPPADRPYPVWDTPPVKDFNLKEYLKKEAAESVGQESSELI